MPEFQREQPAAESGAKGKYGENKDCCLHIFIDFFRKLFLGRRRPAVSD
jgi:hypothetical protein